MESEMKKHLLNIAGLLLVALSVAIPAYAEAAFSNVILTTRVTVTPDTSAYGAGDCISGAQTIPGVIRQGGGGGTTIAGVTLIDPARQTAANNAMTLWIFNAVPTGTYTANSVCNIAVADRGAFLGSISIAAGDCMLDAANTTVCTKLPNFPASAIAPPNTGATGALYFVPVIVATPTYGANNLTFVFLTQPN